LTGKTKNKNLTPFDKRVSKSIAHSTRIDILRILNERTASPKELAEAMKEGVSQVSYHVTELHAYGNIELVKTEPRRGAVEHYYRAVTPPLISDEEAAKLSKGAREEISTVMLQSIISEAVGALRSGSFDSKTDRHVSWVPMLLGERGWTEMMELMADTLNRAQRIKDKDAARRQKTGEAGAEVIVTMMGFERSESRLPGS
jgi:DNA-binding transcriptional ArsR family regulator